jgi:peroxiredoxin
MRFLLVLALLQTASAAEPLRSGCSADDPQLATVGTGDQVRVISAVAGWDAPCYKVTVARPGENLAGYILGSTLAAIQEFERQIRKASVAASEAEARLALVQAASAPKTIAGEPDKPKDPLVSTQFEDFSGRDVNGKPLSLSGLGGRVTLVTFWSPSNMASQNDLMRVLPLYNQLHKSGLAAVGISMDPKASHISEALDDRTPTWPQMPDQSGLAARYHVSPGKGETIVLDASHRVVAVGPMGPEIEKAVRQLLAAP